MKAIRFAQLYKLFCNFHIAFSINNSAFLILYAHAVSMHILWQFYFSTSIKTCNFFLLSCLRVAVSKISKSLKFSYLKPAYFFDYIVIKGS